MQTAGLHALTMRERESAPKLTIIIIADLHHHSIL